jgi:hypothetical protein
LLTLVGFTLSAGFREGSTLVGLSEGRPVARQPGPHPSQACPWDAFKLQERKDGQLIGGVTVTVVVRSVPRVSVRCGTRGGTSGDSSR